MTQKAKLLDGKLRAKECLAELKGQLAQIASFGERLALGTLRVGESKDAIIYSNYLKNLLEKVGIDHRELVLAEDVSERQVIDELIRFSQDSLVTGIMVFSPLPKKLNATNILNNIPVLKDVEGRTFLKSHFGVFSPTANAVIQLLLSAHSPHLAGKEAVVIGHSDLVGKPIAILLMDKMATVTVCHKETKNLDEVIKKSDIVVAAVGKANIIKGEWIKPGAIVIDVGENLVGSEIIGDVEFQSACQRASFISPVPGGVGPLTNVMLVKNLIHLHQLQKEFNGNNASSSKK